MCNESTEFQLQNFSLIEDEEFAIKEVHSFQFLICSALESGMGMDGMAFTGKIFTPEFQLKH